MLSGYLNGLVLLHINNNIHADVDDVMYRFASRGTDRLAILEAKKCNY